MATEARKRAVKKYDEANTKQVHLKLNLKTDADILERLANVDNVQGYIKELVRADMRKTVDTIIVDIENMQPGYRNKEALNTAVKEEHRVLTKVINNLQVMIDVDTKTVLRVDYWC